jgi:hypothetical protein
VSIKSTTQHPQPSIPEGADRSSVRFDSSTIRPSEMPPLKLPARNVIDSGVMRLGSCTITSAR